MNQIPTSVLLTDIYGEFGKGLGWSLERNQIHTDLSMVSDGSENSILNEYMIHLETHIKNNSPSLLTDLSEERNNIQIEFNQARTLFLKVLCIKTNLYSIEGALKKDINNSLLHTGIIYIVEDGKICDLTSVNILNTLILENINVKKICIDVLICYTKLAMITDTLVKCIIMAKMTGQVPEEV